jgi:restriction endonuclease S subunit
VGYSSNYSRRKEKGQIEYGYFSISEGLPAEIEARQKQYEYYRDKLLSFKQA